MFKDINECNDATPPCDDLATCKNSQGSFGCLCRLGYHGDGRAGGTGCVDDNECLEAESK